MIRYAVTLLRNSRQCVSTVCYSTTHQQDPDVSDVPETSEDDPVVEVVPIVPQGSRMKIFNRKPDKTNHNSAHVQFAIVKADILRLSKTGDTDALANRFRRYILENPKSHYIASGLIQVMITAFGNKGEVDRCHELFTLYNRLGRTGPRDRGNNMQYTLMQNAYLLSLIHCTDVDRAKEAATKFVDKENVQQLHPIVRDTLNNVLRCLHMEEQLLETMTRCVEVGLQPDALLNLVRDKLRIGENEAALEMFEKHIDDVGDLHADHYALLALVVTELYRDGKAAYKPISRFAKCPPYIIKEFSHFSAPVSDTVTGLLCQNYEVVLHVAAKRRVGKLFRIIGGRDGLTRQIKHISRRDYVSVTQYIVQLCKYYGIVIDETFWSSLIVNYFHVEDNGSKVDYREFGEFYRSIKLYPLSTPLWIKVIRWTRPDQIADIYQDLMKIGLMNDDIYTCLVLHGGKIKRELEALEKHYKLTEDFKSNVPKARRGYRIQPT